MPMRTDYCGLLRASDTGRTVTLCGWVDRRREHGEHLAFVDVRDHTGVTQCVVDGASDLRSEYVVQPIEIVRITPNGAQWIKKKTDCSDSRPAGNRKSHRA